MKKVEQYRLQIAIAALDILAVSVFRIHATDVCSREDTNCGNADSTRSGVSWKSFGIVDEKKWIAFDRLAERYATWHEAALKNEGILCKDKKVLVFSPNAGLGDSIGALTTAYIYAIRAGRMFFIDWKPYHWTMMFEPLPFDYDYQKASEMTGESGKPLICPDKADKTSFLEGHVTSSHPIVIEVEKRDFRTSYYDVSKYFLRPAKHVTEVMSQITEGFFNNANLEKGTILHKVALVIRTGIGEYNQFLTKGDENNFVTCFVNYARKFSTNAGTKKVKFVVFVTSDHADTKQAVIRRLHKLSENFSVEIATLEDSAIHVMHMTKAESKKAAIRTRVSKTIAEFFLIGMCDVRFLTHGSLFGKVAAELGGNEEGDFFISDSHCDGEREKYSYLQCHRPKYPRICGLS